LDAAASARADCLQAKLQVYARWINADATGTLGPILQGEARRLEENAYEARTARIHIRDVIRLRDELQSSEAPPH
jgi:hypothetical protein